jgi:hypothetical protein
MQRRIQRADNHRVSVHGFKETRKILALHGQKLLQSLGAAFWIFGQNHGLHVRDAIGREEHVLGAAQSDAFSAERARGFSIAWNIGIGSDAEVSAEFVGPSHELDEDGRVRIRVLGFGLA